MEFNIGDRVIVYGTIDELDMNLKTGTIRAISSRSGNLGIEFDEPFDEGHDLEGNARHGYGRWSVYGDDIRLISSIDPDEELDESEALNSFLDGYRVS